MAKTATAKPDPGTTEPTKPTLRDRAASLTWDPDELRAFLVDLIDALAPPLAA